MQEAVNARLRGARAALLLDLFCHLGLALQGRPRV
jgi:hypothetical protein